MASSVPDYWRMDDLSASIESCIRDINTLCHQIEQGGNAELLREGLQELLFHTANLDREGRKIQVSVPYAVVEKVDSWQNPDEVTVSLLKYADGRNGILRQKVAAAEAAHDLLQHRMNKWNELNKRIPSSHDCHPPQWILAANQYDQKMKSQDVSDGLYSNMESSQAADVEWDDD